MERRKFGNTGVEVSAISLGCWIFGVDWWGHYTDEDGIRLMKFAQDQGIKAYGSATPTSVIESDPARRLDATAHELAALGLYFLAREAPAGELASDAR